MEADQIGSGHWEPEPCLGPHDQHALQAGLREMTQVPAFREQALQPDDMARHVPFHNVSNCAVVDLPAEVPSQPVG